MGDWWQKWLGWREQTSGWLDRLLAVWQSVSLKKRVGWSIGLAFLVLMVGVGTVGWYQANRVSQSEVLQAVAASSGGSSDSRETAGEAEIKKEELVGAVEKEGAPKSILVDVSGAVVAPGLKELAVGSRVQLALEVAGGLSWLADADYVARVLNLAQWLEDGDKIFIPTRAQVATFQESQKPLLSAADTSTPLLTKASGGSPTEPKEESEVASQAEQAKIIPVNTASEAELDELPGVGPATARKIVAGRPYVDQSQLCKVINNSKTCEGLVGRVSF